MSEPKRYTGKTEGTVLGSPHWEHLEGEWVKWDDYVRLKAEVERLTNNCDYLDQKLDDEMEKSAMLCGQIMRLTKAGDAMACHLVCSDLPNDVCGDLMKKWNAAKEGKQP
jgi:hypothetical protein